MDPLLIINLAYSNTTRKEVEISFYFDLIYVYVQIATSIHSHINLSEMINDWIANVP